jgi:rhomboid family GlyGly-CTERM serine protease
MSEGIPRKPDAQTTATWWLFGLLGAVVVLLSLGGESWTQALRYEREAVLAGDFWRLVTGHLVHGSSRHLLLNGIGIVLVASLFPRHYPVAAWLLVLVGSMAAIDVGFVFWEPQVTWYVGLSGVLHGALAAGAIAWWRYEKKALALALSVILIGKLAWEQWRGGLPLAGSLPVVVEAHLYGATGGALVAALIQGVLPGWSFRPRSL